MLYRGIAGVCAWVIASIALAQGADISPDEFQNELDRAIELNTTAPWRESQAILDELRPHLEIASSEQYAEYAYLEARNQTLSGDLEAALSQIDALLTREMSPRQKIRTYRLGANIAILARRFEEAFGYLREGLALLGNPGNELLNEGLYGFASYSYAQVGELERAREFGHLALAEARKTGISRDLCYAEQQLGFVNKLDDRIEDARDYYQAAVSHCLDAGDELSASISESGLADLLRGAGEYSEAESLFEVALDRLIRAEFQSGISETSLYYARLEFARDRPDKVVELLTPVLENLANDQTWDYLAEAHRMLADIARDRGDLASAMEHYEARMEAREKHLDMERARRIAYLEVEFDLKRTRQQLELLEEQARARELEIQGDRQQARLRLVIYVLTALSFVLLLALLRRATRDRRRFRDLSHRDGLTALSNHTRFFELADKAFDFCKSKKLPFILILSDIDHFKQVNDRNGHLAGDEVLRRTGARLRECFGDKGFIGRIGGEEFGIALPRVHVNEIRDALDQLRGELSRSRADDSPTPVTMSFGVATLRGDNDSLTALRERADEALYQAKRSGRDRVVYADHDE